MIDEYLRSVAADLRHLPRRDRTALLSDLEAHLHEAQGAGGDVAVEQTINELGRPEDVAARLAEAWSDADQRRGEFAGLPYDVRPAAAPRPTRGLWNAAETSLFPPKTFGAGRGINLAALAVRLRLVEPDDDDDRAWNAAPTAARLALPAMAVTAAATSVCLTAALWSQLPAQVPTHWGFDGQPDSYLDTRWVITALLGVTVLPALWASRTALAYRNAVKRTVGTAVLCGVVSWAGVITLVAALVTPQAGLLVGLTGVLGVLVFAAVVPGLVLRSGVRHLASRRRTT